tara:strand:+ start:16682 stop:16987 length:306 start_codon:yes stop_codon:yes gene_type:complete
VKELVSSFVRYALIAPMAAILLVMACSRATVENYDKIQSGMSRAEVYEILGKPDEVSAGGLGKLTVSAETWTGHKQVIHVTFGSEKVALKSITPTEASPKP